MFKYSTHPRPKSQKGKRRFPLNRGHTIDVSSVFRTSTENLADTTVCNFLTSQI